MMRRWAALMVFAGTMTVGTTAGADDDVPHHTVGPWVLIGAGATSGAIGTVLEAFALSTARPTNVTVSLSISGGPGPSGGGAAGGNDTSGLQGAAIIAMSLGLGAAAAGLIWHYMEPTSSAHVTVSPTLGGLVLRGTF